MQCRSVELVLDSHVLELRVQALTALGSSFFRFFSRDAGEVRDIVQKVLDPEWIKRTNSAKAVHQSDCMNQNATHFVVFRDACKDLVTGYGRTVPRILEAES